VKTNDREIVSAVRRALVEHIGKDRFTVWFGPGVRIEVADGTICVAARDQFAVERIRKRFVADLRCVGQQFFGDTVSVTFRIDASLNDTAVEGGRPAPGVRGSARSESPSRPTVASSSSGGDGREAGLSDLVVGSCNRIAFAAAQAVLQQPGQMSPLLVYGPTGTGKTHLLEGIASTARRSCGIKRVVMLSSEQFTSYFLEALRGSGLPNFRRKYRDVNLLLIDDVQFFCGKDATIVELKHTVDTLLRAGRQLVFSADRPLLEIDGLGPDLIARISGGLVCGMDAPDEETRLAIARRMAAARGLQVPSAVLAQVARQVTGDVRLIAGALNRLKAHSQALQRPITAQLADDALVDIYRSSQRVVRLPDIDDAICSLFGVDARGLHSHRKSKTLAQPRMLAMWLARKYTRAAYSEIGEHFGHRSHSTVISAHKKVEHWLADGAQIQLGHGDCDVRDVIRRVEARLRTA
jgi:chromosomal replication initiator protein